MPEIKSQLITRPFSRCAQFCAPPRSEMVSDDTKSGGQKIVDKAMREQEH